MKWDRAVVAGGLEAAMVMLIGCGAPERAGPPAHERPLSVAAPPPADVGRAAAETPSPAACPPRVHADQLEWSSDGALLVTSCAGAGCGAPPDTLVDVWELRAGRPAPSLGAGAAQPSVWLDESGFLLSVAGPADGGGHVGLWETRSFKQLWSEDFPCISGSAVDHAGLRFFVASCGGNLSAFDARRQVATGSPEDSQLTVNTLLAVRYLERERRLLVVDENLGLHLLDSDTLRVVARLDVGLSGPFAWELSPDQKRVALGLAGGGVQIVNTNNLSLSRSSTKRESEVWFLSWVSADQLVASLVDGSRVFLTASSGQSRELVAPHEAIGCSQVEAQPPSAAEPRGRFAYFEPDCRLRVADASSARVAYTIPVSPPAIVVDGGTPEPQVAWSPRGDLLAVVGGDCKLKLYDAATGALRSEPTFDQLLGDLSLCTQPVAFSPDGRFLALADGKARLYRIADGRQLSLAAFQHGSSRAPFIVSNGAFTGDPAHAACSAEPARVQSSTVLADFLAGR